MLEKVELDAVVVATPHDFHREPALAALDRGLHVLLEKPLATTIAENIQRCSFVSQQYRIAEVIAQYIGTEPQSVDDVCGGLQCGKRAKPIEDVFVR